MRSATPILVAMAVGLAIAVGARWVFVRLTANRSSPRDVLSLSPPKIATLQWQPPRQDEPWTTPPTGLPDSIVAVANVLFELGFADPRGCEYREVELPGEAEANRNLAAPRPATHAWVMPQGAVDGPRYAVAWNGLVYPVKRLGAAADLDADIRALSIAPPALPASGDRGSASISGLRGAERGPSIRQSPDGLAACSHAGHGGDSSAARPYRRRGGPLASRNGRGGARAKNGARARAGPGTESWLPRGPGRFTTGPSEPMSAATISLRCHRSAI